jgi:antitoxin VapB
MPINITNPEADSLTRRFALMEGVGITEAIARRLATETPIETAARLRAKHGIAIGRTARNPLPPAAFDDMWGDGREHDTRGHRPGQYYSVPILTTDRDFSQADPETVALAPEL